MPFPESPRVVFEVNPLQEVVCQLRFPSILKIAAEPPAAFQERIRATYPILEMPETRLIDRIGIGGVGPAMGIAQEAGSFSLGQGFGPPQQMYVFMTEGRDRTVRLGPESISLAEAKYERWESFRAELEGLVHHLTELYQPSFFTRVGLRFQDVLDRRGLGMPDVPWKDLLSPEFAGLISSGSPVADEVAGIAGIAEVSLPEPPNARVRIQHGFLESEEGPQEKYAIDSDFFLAERSEVASVLSCLDAFHVQAGRLFRWVISERLLGSLGPQPVPDRTAAA